MSQREVFAFDDLGIPIDNIEGMTFGPALPDGRQTLIIVSDNNFNAGQFTQLIVLAIDIDPAAEPAQGGISLEIWPSGTTPRLTSTYPYHRVGEIPVLTDHADRQPFILSTALATGPLRY